MKAMFAGVEVIAGLLCVSVNGQLLSTKVKNNIIQDVFRADPALAASAIRLSFHDCVGKVKTWYS